MALALTLIATTSLSGCIVQSNGTSGVLEVNWTQSFCTSGGTVRIRASRNNAVESELTGIDCSRGTQALFVPPGTYSITADSVASDGFVNGSVTVSNLTVFSGQTTATAPLTLSGGNGDGEVHVTWTIAGESAATGCGKAGLTTIIVSLLAPTGGAVLSTAQTTCSDGGINLTGVASGTYRLQLDGRTSAGALTWGNAAPTNAFTVAPGTTVKFDSPIELVDLRAAISLNWQFFDNATCNGKNVDFVLIDVRDGAGKIVVPMNDPFAKKPCDIGPNSPYNYRVIDMQFAKPTCQIPPNAKGLVICGITGKAIGVSVTTIDAFNGALNYGGFIKIENIPMATHTAIPEALNLSPCNDSTNVCATP